MTTFAGRHVLAELYGVEPARLDDEAGLRAALEESLAAAGTLVVQVVSHRFTPRGVTVLALLAESHASLHGWPEHGSAFLDVFTCGPHADPERAVRLLAAALGAEGVHANTVARPAAVVPAAVVPAAVVPAVVVEERLAPGVSRGWRVEEVLAEVDTGYQHVLIGRTAQGVALFCDGERQSTEHSQLVYHEALVLPALLLADRPERVLVVGSGEGVASQLALAAGASTVDHVDIDAECVRLCARHLPYGYTVDELAAAEAGEGPVRMHYADGHAFLGAVLGAFSGQVAAYDVVVLDLPDERPEEPDAQHNRLYGAGFLRRCAAALQPGGVVAAQAGCPTLWRNDTLIRSVRRFGEVFGTVVPYCSDEHEWAFLAGRQDVVADPLRRMLDALATLPYRPASIDADALRRGAVLPHAVRQPPAARQ